MECMRVGVFRKDFPETFKIEPSQIVRLEKEAYETIAYYLQMEEKLNDDDIDWDEVDKVVDEIKRDLRNLCDPYVV